MNNTNLLRAAVCDDDPSIISLVTAYIHRICAEMGIDCRIFPFQDGEEILSDYPAALDLLFLDIEMPLVNGIEAGKEIRTQDPNVLVVFLSSHEKYAIQGYEVGACRYLLKPLTWERFCSSLRLPLEKHLSRQQQTLHIKNREGTYSFSGAEIYYAATTPHKTVDLHTQRGTVECFQTLTTLEKQLAPLGFFRCHSGFLVNFSYVHHIGKDFLILKDGTWVPVSKHRKKELMQAFAAYAGELL